MMYSFNSINKKKIITLLLLLSSISVFAHTTVIDMEKMNGVDSAFLYLKLGFTHILPLGFDHILFMISLYLLKPKLKPVLLQASIFTLAHTVSLGLSMYRIITPPSAIIEPLIAASILFVALQNIFSRKIKTTRLAIVFLFGLVHGMGFASALGQLGLPQNRFFSSLLLFNLGVELGQVTVILVAWLLLIKWFANKMYYRRYIVIPLSVIIGIIASYFLINRISVEKDGPVVDARNIENVLKNYNDSSIQKSEAEILFWKNRIRPGVADYSNSMRYAGALVQHFRLTGNIADVKKSDSVLLSLIHIFKKNEAAPYLSLSNHAILQHEFVKADSLLKIALQIGLKKYDAAVARFDVNFELGNIDYAAMNLGQIQQSNDYGYQFRCSKLMHYKAAVDSSINAMKAAFALGDTHIRLRQSALSNLGDLYIHTGEIQKAKDCYMQSITTFKSDMHSYTGLAWIALMHDKNDTLAERILKFVASKTQSPEPLFKIIAVAQERNNKKEEVDFATKFVNTVSDIRYGKMYNKYLIWVYTGILNNPQKAVSIAKSELQNRNTAQTQAWYAYALFKNGQKQEAMNVFEQSVSGKPLEALELYWMGKLLEASGKKGTAVQYFYEAAKNKYDLNPTIINDLKNFIEI
ncbi:MAG: HupE/UreJ family protein [Chitinophagaceae bacterium]|nr:HupE/UreJ family protein [Chitinophagaceae bacterium]